MHLFWFDSKLLYCKWTYTPPACFRRSWDESVRYNSGQQFRKALVQPLSCGIQTTQRALGNRRRSAQTGHRSIAELTWACTDKQPHSHLSCKSSMLKEKSTQIDLTCEIFKPWNNASPAQSSLQWLPRIQKTILSTCHLSSKGVSECQTSARLTLL